MADGDDDNKGRGTDDRLIVLSADDNVVVAARPIEKGAVVQMNGRNTRTSAAISIGHKLACKPIMTGEKILKYGVPIGSAIADILPGDHVHLHNMKSDYTPSHSLAAARAEHGDRERKNR